MDTSTVTAADIMTRQLSVTTPETNVRQAIERLIEQGVSGLPVIDGSGNFVGRFSERSAISALDLAAIQLDSYTAAELREVRAATIMDRFSPVLQASQDVFQSANELITRRVSGAPVVDMDGNFCGVFSEKSAMHVFIGLCWEQLPSSRVTAWIDRQEGRSISEDTGLDEIIDRFQNTQFRRLMVMRGPKLAGQITRRNALQAALQRSHQPLESLQPSAAGHAAAKTTVAGWMEVEVQSTRHGADVLAIAQQFLHSSARQLPVLDEQRLDGQISRSDLLRAIRRFFPDATSSDSGMQPLYLSSVNKHDAYSVLK